MERINYLTIGPKIIELAQNGLTAKEIATSLSIGRKAIDRFAKQNNLILKDGRGASYRKENFPCSICGTLFHAKRCLYESGVKTSCSKKCSSVLKSKNGQSLIGKNKEIIEILQECSTRSQAANRLGCTVKHLEYFCKKEGIDLFTSRHLSGPIISKNFVKIVEMHTNHHSISGIARHFNVRAEAIKEALHERGYVAKNPNYLSNEEILERLHPNLQVLSIGHGGHYEVQCKLHPKEVYRRKAADLGGNCFRCGNNGTSKPEREILEFIESLGFKVLHRYKFDGRKEIDIFIPDLKIGIEFCGLYHHSEAFDCTRQKHSNKMHALKSMGIRLITIFGDEWDYRPTQVKNFLISLLGKNRNSFYARLCKVQEMYNETDVKAFIEENHIQSPGTHSIAFGLYLENELLGIITGNPHHRLNSTGILVLNRLCFKSGVSVIGGASKLFSVMLKWASNNSIQKIVTWSDNRWSEGKVYEKMGFILEKEMGPDYSYVASGNKRKSKQSMKKNSLERSSDLTEKELRRAQNYYRIWDCGKKRWVFTDL